MTHRTTSYYLNRADLLEKRDPIRNMNIVKKLRRRAKRCKANERYSLFQKYGIHSVDNIVFPDGFKMNVLSTSSDALWK